VTRPDRLDLRAPLVCGRRKAGAWQALLDAAAAVVLEEHGRVLDRTSAGVE
jgi:hypothetical protein